MLLNNRLAIVTGAGRGIGRETAINFAREGANVVVVSRNKKELESTAKKILSFGRETQVISADVSVERDVKRIFEKTLEKFNRVDIVVNNASIHLRKSVEDTTVEEWDTVMAVNLRSTFLCCRECSQIMKKQNYGKIINISSQSGTKGSAFQGAYCSTKFGQIGFTQVLQDELKDYNINVNAILPGGVDTKLLRDSYPEINRALLLRPEHIAKAITFLASDDASGVMGASYAIWGGQEFYPNLFNI